MVNEFELGTLPVIRGAYTASNRYYYDNLVQYNYCTYQCTTTNANGISGVPPTNSSGALNTGWAFFAGVPQAILDRIAALEADVAQLKNA